MIMRNTDPTAYDTPTSSASWPLASDGLSTDRMQELMGAEGMGMAPSLFGTDTYMGLYTYTLAVHMAHSQLLQLATLGHYAMPSPLALPLAQLPVAAIPQLPVHTQERTEPVWPPSEPASPLSQCSHAPTVPASHPPSPALSTHADEGAAVNPEQDSEAQTQLQDTFGPAQECANCMTQETTMWRRTGERILCNACGLYERLNKAPRPLHMAHRKIHRRRARRRPDVPVPKRNIAPLLPNPAPTQPQVLPGLGSSNPLALYGMLPWAM